MNRKFDTLHSKRGVALIVCIGLLALLMISATTFTILMRVERSSASNLRHATAARLLAKGCLNYAIAQIERSREPQYSGEKLYNDGSWVGKNPTADFPVGYWTYHFGDDSQGYSLNDYHEQSWEEAPKNKAVFPNGILHSIDHTRDRSKGRKSFGDARVMSAGSAKYIPSEFKPLMEATKIICKNKEVSLNAPEWIPVKEGDFVSGRYAFSILETTGLIDLNSLSSVNVSAGTSANREKNTTSAIVLDSKLFSKEFANDNFARTFVTKKNQHGAYASMGEFMTDVEEGKMGVNKNRVANFDVQTPISCELIPEHSRIDEMNEEDGGMSEHERFLAAWYAAKKDCPKIDLSEAAWKKRGKQIIGHPDRQFILWAFELCGLSPLQAVWAYCGLIDYMDEDSTPYPYLPSGQLSSAVESPEANDLVNYKSQLRRRNNRGTGLDTDMKDGLKPIERLVLHRPLTEAIPVLSDFYVRMWTHEPEEIRTSHDGITEITHKLKASYHWGYHFKNPFGKTSSLQSNSFDIDVKVFLGGADLIGQRPSDALGKAVDELSLDGIQTCQHSQTWHAKSDNDFIVSGDNFSGSIITRDTITTPNDGSTPLIPDLKDDKYAISLFGFVMAQVTDKSSGKVVRKWPTTFNQKAIDFDARTIDIGRNGPSFGGVVNITSEEDEGNGHPAYSYNDMKIPKGKSQPSGGDGYPMVFAENIDLLSARKQNLNFIYSFGSDKVAGLNMPVRNSLVKKIGKVPENRFPELTRPAMGHYVYEMAKNHPEDFSAILSPDTGYFVAFDGGRDGDNSLDSADRVLQPYIANQPLTSIGELGHLRIGYGGSTIALYNHNHAKRTYGGGSVDIADLPSCGFHPVLDYFTIEPTSQAPNVRININTPHTTSLAAVFYRAPFKPLKNMSPNFAIRNIADANEIADYLINTGPFTHLSDLGILFGTSKDDEDLNDTGFVEEKIGASRAMADRFAVKKMRASTTDISELERESLIANTCNLLTTEGETFTILMRADAFSAKFGSASVDEGNVLSSAYAVAQVLRKPVYRPDALGGGVPRLTHEYVVQYFRIINE